MPKKYKVLEGPKSVGASQPEAGGGSIPATGSASDTPLTDAYAQAVHEGRCLDACDSFAHDEKCPVCFGEYLIADFARALEGDRDDLRRALSEVWGLLLFDWGTMPDVMKKEAVDLASKTANDALVALWQRTMELRDRKPNVKAEPPRIL